MDKEKKYIKFLLGKTSGKEDEALYEELSSSKEHLSRFRKIKLGIERYEREQTDTSFVAQDLNLLRRKISHKRRFQIGRSILKYAAVFLLTIGLVELWHYQRSNIDPVQYNCMMVARGEQSRIVLSDSTVVWLASDSRLEFPDHFGKEERKVLLAGKAYFKVAHNKDVPFIVKTQDAQVKVLGTEFNIQAYPNEPVIETSLIKGCVDIRFFGGNKTKARGKIMRPGEKICFNKANNRFVSTAFDAHQELSWREGRLSFRDESFLHISRRLERFYDVHITFENEKIKDYRYSGDFDEESIQEALEAISKITPFNFQKEGREIIIKH